MTNKQIVLSSDVALKEHRGRYSRDEVVSVLNKTRMTLPSREIVLSYLVNGKRLKDMPRSKQHAYNRIKKIIDMYYADS